MSIDFLSVAIRHERRVRLVFSNALASGAFGAPCPTFYSIVSLDGRGIAPALKAALIVPGSTNVVELVLASDLVPDALYEISAVGVPAVDLSVTPGGSTLQARFGRTFSHPNREPIRADRERLLYGSDLIWNGTDFEEAPNGDLARISGTANVTKALYHAIETAGLAWDPNWGAGARDFVDSPSLEAGSLRGTVTEQILRDPRVNSIRTSIELDGENTYLQVTPTLTTGEPIAPVSITVPNAA